MTIVNLTVPVISGLAQVGQTLSTSNGTWTSDDPLTYAYQWERCDAGGGSCVDITGATSSFYTVDQDDLGGTLRSEVTATEVPVPPPTPGNPYFNPNIADGLARLPWTTFFSYTSPGYKDLGLYGSPPSASTADGRVAVVADPGGSGEKCIRFENRNSDPNWPGYQLNKSEIRTTTDLTMNKSSAQEGDIRWFGFEMYLPYSGGGEQFNWPTSGADTFATIWDLHPSSAGMVTGLNWYAGTQFIRLCVPSGFPPTYGGGWSRHDLLRILNADGSRYTANYNRWIKWEIGVRYGVGNGSSSNGWVSVWIDGVNVKPQFSCVTLYTNDSGSYYKHGLYKSASGVYGGNGTSVMYYRRDKIGMTRADVD